MCNRARSVGRFPTSLHAGQMLRPSDRLPIKKDNITYEAETELRRTGDDYLDLNPVLAV